MNYQFQNSHQSVQNSENKCIQNGTYANSLPYCWRKVTVKVSLFQPFRLHLLMNVSFLVSPCFLHWIAMKTTFPQVLV